MTSAYLIIRYNNVNITESISILEIVKQVISIASKTKLSVVCVIRLFLVRNSFEYRIACADLMQEKC